MTRPVPIPPLTPVQQALADARAQCAVEVLRVLDERTRTSAAGGFTTVRDLRGAARQANVAEPDWRAERDMVRAAGFGRLATARVLGEWASMVDVALEAARALGEPLDLRPVSRWSLAWQLAGCPDGHPLDALHDLTGRIAGADLHRESPERPYYRRLLDGWRAVLSTDAPWP